MFPPKVLAWLEGRGLSNSIIETLAWKDGWIGIPIQRPDGSKFYKWRRNPELDGTDTLLPKYKADMGGGRTLFGQRLLGKSDDVFIVEGELDALLLQSSGLVAVSSTTGAGNWNEAWNRLFDRKNVYICYDADEAGLKGSMKVGSRLREHAHLVKIIRHDGSLGKDVTEWLKSSGHIPFLELIKRPCFTWLDPPAYEPPPRVVRVSSGGAKESILEVCERAGIVLRKVGREYVGKSPFRSESQASFSVNPDKNCWFDYGEGSGSGVNGLIERLRESGYNV